jgi:predicted acylesterase/phospholipase RssA
MARTFFFKSCLGVFQGGGCRAAAFVGAYEEAVRNGVSFSEVAGTSAGSIVAALIGAGAGPKDLREAIVRMNFKSFLSAPDRKAARGLSGRVLGMKFPQYVDLFYDQGFYSSSQIKSWMDEQLNRLLPEEKKPITFQSLPFPTYIVSTDLARSEAKIWSPEATPNELVSDAVQASCAIPIFFQPVSRRYVDGGVLSNLPAFVFSDRGRSERALASRVLAFTLIADESDPREWGTENFLKLLANAVVDGAQQLQVQLQPNLHVVKIPTGNIKATDFDKMTAEATNSLIDSGTRATRTFFDGELLHVKSVPQNVASICYGTDELYTRVTEALELDIERIVISDHNTDWVYSLFPSLLCWRARGVQVDVIVPELGDKADGTYRRKLLLALGANLTVLSTQTAVPMRAFIIIPRDVTHLRAIIGIEKQSRSQNIEAIIYEGFVDEGVIRSVLERLDDLIASKSREATLDPRLATDGVPRFATDGHDLLISRIRSIAQYSKAGVDINIENIEISNLVSLTRFVREYKYQQIRHLIKLYQDTATPIFSPAAVALATGESSIVTPPVVEESGGKFILVEGSTRATFCRDEGVPKFKCIVVRGVKDPLPSTPIPFNQVRVVGRTLDASHRYEHFNYAHFRSIERAVHPLNGLR